MARTGGPRSARRFLRRPRAPAPSRRPHRRPLGLDCPRRRPRRVPDRGRPDSRGRDRVGPLPAPRGRRSHSAPRCSPVLQAPRARTRGRERRSRHRHRVRRARLRCVRRQQPGRLRARRGADSRPAADRRSRPLTHAPARAGAALEPPQRRRRHLRRCRSRRREPAVRRALRGRAAAQRAHRRPPPPIRQRSRRRQPTRARLRRTGERSRGSRTAPRRDGLELARSGLQRLVPGQAHRRRRPHPGSGGHARRCRPGSSQRRPRRGRADLSGRLARL